MKLKYTTLFLLFSVSIFAQKWVSPNFDNHHLDFRDLGYPGVNEIPADNSSPYYQKRAYQFEAMATGTDGSIFIGESDRRGKLFIFIPGGEIFKGGLNLKNPR